MTFTELLTILNKKCPLFAIGHDTGFKVTFGTDGGTFDFCGKHFGFTFGSDDAEWFDDTGASPCWTKVTDERFLEQILK